jgi:hypothetical protein
MIMELWMYFIGIAVLLYVIGYYTKNDILRILACIFIFSLGMQLDPLGGGILYNSGTLTNYNATLYPFSTADGTGIYTTFSSHLFGFYLMVTGILTFVFIMFERRWSFK